MEDQKEKHERTTFVLGILVAAVIGFTLNIYASVYYDVFMLGDKKLTDYDELAILLPAVVLVYSYGLLSFLIYDYKNKIDIGRSFMGRLFDYYDNVFWPVRFAKGVYRFFAFAFKWTIAFVVGLSLFQTSGLWGLIIWIGILVCWRVGKYFYQRKYKK